MFAFTRCFCLKKAKQHPGYEDPTTLASETPFTVNEVEALYDLFKKISSSIIDDGFIHKEEFWLALFRNRSEQNLFADRVFDLFDIKRNGVIEFGEFVRSLSIFHPSAPKEDKMEFAFKLYDLRQTGYIERDELKEMVLAILSESDMEISEDVVGSIVDKTMAEADLKGDGKIDKEEWKEFVSRNPTILRNMTLPYLKLKRNRGCRFISSTLQPDMTPESTCFSPIFFNVDIKPSNLKFFWFISHPKYNAKYVVPVC